MDTEFFQEFNAMLPEMEAAFGEKWSYNNATYPAIAIDDLQLSRFAGAAGGPLAQASVTVHVRKAVFNNSKVGKGKIILVRDNRVRVMTIVSEGDASVQLVCGPVSAVLPST